MNNESGHGLLCNRCGDKIYSLSVHDFKYCSCKAIAVDGGYDYLKILGHREDWSIIDQEGNLVIIDNDPNAPISD